ncbi:MAG TPA: methylmalonyl-CoA mutase family protein [Caldilinea sp.]|nr:methylmalonyl-CoA mutase family protein [Caldilinea sp.]
MTVCSTAHLSEHPLQGRRIVVTQAALQALANAAVTDANLMPYLVEAVEAWATVGEICATLQQVFGEYDPALVF